MCLRQRPGGFVAVDMVRVSNFDSKIPLAFNASANFASVPVLRGACEASRKSLFTDYGGDSTMSKIFNKMSILMQWITNEYL